MNNNKFHLAYSIDNQNIAKEIDNHLSRVGIELDHIIVSHQADEEPLRERLKNAQHFVFLLISDNFLKNLKCMTRGLFMLQELMLNKKAQPIIVDGREQIPGTNTFQTSPTEFDRMTNVIRYMNFWQDSYLDLRKEKRTIPPEEEIQFDERLKVVRAISSEMGEFLKVLKNSEYWTYPEFKNNGYELFFNAINNSGLHAALNQAIANGEIPTVSPTFGATDIPAPIIEEPAPTIATTPVQTPVSPPEVEPVNELFQEKQSSVTAASIIQSQVIKREISTSSPISQLTDTTDSSPSNIQEEVSPKTEEKKTEIDYIKISEDNLKKKGKTPLLDRLIEYRKVGEQEEKAETQRVVEKIESKEELPSPTPKNAPIDIETASIYREEKVEASPKIVEQKTVEIVKEKDVQFEETINQIIEEDISEERITEEKIIPAPPAPKPKVTSHPILTEIFHDDDAELDSDEMIGNFELSSAFNTSKSKKNKLPSLTPKEKLQEAKKMIAAGKLYAGLNIVRELVEQNQQDANLRYEYAIHLMDGAESYKAARRELEKVIQLNPKNVDAFTRLAILSDKKGDYLLSKNYYEKALELDSDNANLYYRLGLLVTTKFPDLQDQAANFFKKSIKKDNSNPDAHYRYGLILDEHLKKPKKALQQFDLTLQLQPDHPFVAYDLALIHYRMGAFEKAAKFYKKAVVNNPELKTKANDRAFLIPSKKSEIADDKDAKIDALFDDLSAPIPTEVEEVKPLSAPIVFEELTPARNENFEKVVLISGATSGIGNATAQVFARNGYRLILTGRRTERLAEIKADFEKNYPTEVQTLEFDVRKIDAAQAAIASLGEAWNSIDILINNAGLAKGFDPIHEGKLEDWETMIDTNVKGLLYLTRLISPGMVARQKGHIINVCSTAGHEVYPNGNVYCATKHAVDALTKGMRLDLYKHGLRVSQVSPAHVEETEFARVRFDWDTERAKIYEDFQPLRAEDVANTIYFIATQPAHVNIQDVLMMGRQQANSSNVDRSGR